MVTPIAVGNSMESTTTNNNAQMLFYDENKIRRNSDTAFSMENLILFTKKWQDFNGNLTLF